MPTIPVWAWKLLAGLAVIAGVAGTTWFAADTHYSKIIEHQKAVDQQAADDARVEAAAALTRYAQAAQEINNEAANTISGMSDDIRDLGVRGNDARQALAICTAPVPVKPVPDANGSGTAPSAAVNPEAGGSVEDAERLIVIQPGQLKDDLEIARKAIETELLFRQWLRENGQAQAEAISTH